MDGEKAEEGPEWEGNVHTRGKAEREVGSNLRLTSGLPSATTEI